MRKKTKYSYRVMLTGGTWIAAARDEHGETFHYTREEAYAHLISYYGLKHEDIKLLGPSGKPQYGHHIKKRLLVPRVEGDASRAQRLAETARSKQFHQRKNPAQPKENQFKRPARLMQIGGDNFWETWNRETGEKHEFKDYEAAWDFLKACRFKDEQIQVVHYIPPHARPIVKYV